MSDITLYNMLPEIYSRQIRSMSVCSLREIRMRVGYPLCMVTDRTEIELWPCVEPQNVEEVTLRATRFSSYAFAESIRDGYITVEGGHRIGICGTGFVRDGELQSIRLPTSVCIRVANQIKGYATALFRALKGSLIILGPPGAGKTTLMRDLLAQLSDCGKMRIGLIDERNEIAACVNGSPQLYVGRRTDVLTNVKKRTGIMMMLRTMNPEWIAVDEITEECDIYTMEQASHCGVRLIATAHGSSLSDLRDRPLYRKLLDTGVFTQVAIIKPDRSYYVEEIGI